ncbi:MAG: EthD domain-containing protein [Thermodesulfobacteriota bacterium]
MNEALRASRGGPDGFDGIAELWWHSAEDLAAATASEEGRRASLELLEDERRFIDLARSPLWLAREHEVLPWS